MATANRQKGPGRVAVATAAGLAAAGFMWAIVSGPQPTNANADQADPSVVAQNQQSLQSPTANRRGRQASGVGSVQSPLGTSGRGEGGEDDGPFFQSPGSGQQSPSAQSPSSRQQSPSLQSPSTSQQQPFTTRPRLRSRGS